MKKIKSLAPQHIKVLELSAQGYSRKETANAMNVADITVQRYRQDILYWANAKTLTQAVAIWLGYKIEVDK